ncbi:MAG: hypothetical protein ABSB42_10550 [Tepidisphaeraceae bacterium]|jgi:hypothetical protein
MRVQLIIDRVQDDMLVVTNCSNLDVPIGTVLTILWAERVEIAGQGFNRQRIGDVEQVSLAVAGVNLSNREIPEIPKGYSAGIRIRGAGMKAVQNLLREKEKLPTGRYTQIFLGAN